jgi:NAD(P)H-hydrate repair Nnr-like enzyme with NAD(P)H-hydrate dehydratase domain
VNDLRQLLAEHPLAIPTGGKDAAGTVLVIGADPACPGAALLCAEAALRIGGGRVQAVVHPEVRAACAAAAWELHVGAWDTAEPPPPAVLDQLAGAAVVVLGPGHRHLDEAIVEVVAKEAPGSLVLDAGALDGLEAVRGRADLVIAPNPTEARRIVGELDDEGALARALAERGGHPVAVRGGRTVVSDGAACWSFGDPPPGLGTPGSGDVFIGVLAGLLAAGNEAVGALGWATRLHAEAGRACGPAIGYLAGDVARSLPGALASCR